MGAHIILREFSYPNFKLGSPHALAADSIAMEKQGIS
jgi:hypothetical protein